MAIAQRSAWPDKAMFASTLVVMASSLGLIVALLAEFAQVDKARIPEALRLVPLPATLLLCGLALAIGIVALQTQKIAWAWLAAVTVVASMAVFGLAAAAGLVAMTLLIVALAEGEDRLPRLAARHWPDKAHAASLVLLVAGLAAIWQGIAIIFQNMDPIVLKQAPPVMGGVDLALGLVCIAGAMEAYKVRHPRVVMLGALAAILSLAAYALGPALGIAAFILVVLAHRENEWV